MTVELKPNKGASVVKTDLFLIYAIAVLPIPFVRRRNTMVIGFLFGLVCFPPPHRADCAIKAIPKLCNPKALPLSVCYV